MEFKQDDSCSVQKSSCFLEIPFFKLSLTKGTLYFYGSFIYIINNKRFQQLVGGLIMIKVCSMCSGMSIEDLKAAY